MRTRQRRLFLIVMISLLLCSCGDSPQKETLEFLNTKWGMTMEETKEAMKLEKEDIEEEKVQTLSAYMKVSNHEEKVFGEKPSWILFEFFDGGDGVNRLARVFVQYSDKTDMQKVLKQMKKSLGAPIDDITIYYPGRDALHPDNLRYDSFSDSDNQKVWGNSMVKDVVSEEQMSDYQKSWTQDYFFTVEPRDWEEFLKSARLTTVVWADGKGEPPEATMCGINFYAYNYVIYKYGLE